MSNIPAITTDVFSAALADLRSALQQRIQDYFNSTPADPGNGVEYAASPEIFFRQHIPELARREEYLILMLALAPQLQPGFFESVILSFLPDGGDFPAFGGVKGTHHRGMLPTGETALFLLAGADVEQRLKLHQYFSETHFFCRKGILHLDTVPAGEPPMSGRIILSRDWADRILYGAESPPRFGPDFPAKRVRTEMDWEDAVLHPQTMQEVKDIATWLAHHRLVQEDDNLKRKIKPGYRVLFYGPSGTGKTLTAALLGKQFGKDVYRVDLSQVVSKYIGETEKNLEIVFRRAETKDWILFFDEADALFGKRTNTQSAHDKYANQEVSYLLQRVEDYDGLLVLASNFKSNLDDAFIRRFQAIVHFPMPGTAERLQLWKKALPANLAAESAIDLPALAAQYQLSGAAIQNAVYYAALQAYARNDSLLKLSDITEGIKKEFRKEEKSF
ncbi:ATP-binding protein [Chitinophagaceae bacterium MMS25-I14]